MLVRATGNNRFVLLMDILGFSKICETENPDYIYHFVNKLVEKGLFWENRELGFKVLYFSDTILLYQEENLPIQQAFLDIYVIASKIFSTLASERIPMRGAISFGSFTTKMNSSSNTNLFYGKALVDAAKLEKEKKWLGIVISKNAIEVLDESTKFMLLSGRVIHKEKHYYLLDPFYSIRGSFGQEIYDLDDNPGYSNEIKAIEFLKDQEQQKSLEVEVLKKYENTIAFLRNIYSQDYYPRIWDLLTDWL